MFEFLHCKTWQLEHPVYDDVTDDATSCKLAQTAKESQNSDFKHRFLLILNWTQK